MRIALIVALALGIYTGTLLASDNFTANTVHNIDSYRKATSAIGIAVVGLTVIITILLHRHLQMKRSGTIFIVSVGLLLVSCFNLIVLQAQCCVLQCIPSAYRLAAVLNFQEPVTTKTKASRHSLFVSVRAKNLLLRYYFTSSTLLQSGSAHCPSSASISIPSLTSSTSILAALALSARSYPWFEADAILKRTNSVHRLMLSSLLLVNQTKRRVSKLVRV